MTTSHSEHERTNSMCSSMNSLGSACTHKSRKLSAVPQTDSIPWCGCWGAGCVWTDERTFSASLLFGTQTLLKRVLKTPKGVRFLRNATRYFGPFFGGFEIPGSSCGAFSSLALDRMWVVSFSYFQISHRTVVRIVWIVVYSLRFEVHKCKWRVWNKLFRFSYLFQSHNYNIGKKFVCREKSINPILKIIFIDRSYLSE